MKVWSEPQLVAVSSALVESVGGHKIIAETLVRRGIIEPAEARAFLDPDFYAPCPPDQLPGMGEAVARIQRAIRHREMVCVWGDFDVDGQTATALLVSALRDVGANVIYYIPNRLREGHGIAIEPLKLIIDQGAQLIITCDTGIAAHEAVNYAQSRAIEMVITDHHNLPASIPSAHAVINPKLLAAEHLLHELPGVGVAYKLIEALCQGQDTSQYLDLVALGIVADVATQTGDTRYLLQKGLEVLRKTQRLGLQTMMELAGLNPSELSEQHIGFTLAPRLNALGRLADANPAVELLTSNDLEQVRILANQLEGYNSERKLLSEQVYGAAQAQIDKDQSLLDHAVLVLSHPQWHTGVVGIVANRLADQYNRPVILLAIPEGEIARGSARSVPGCDITAAISAHADLLLGFGGHAMAAGLSLPVERIGEFRWSISRTVRQMMGKRETLEAALPIDGFVSFSDISLEIVRDIERLSPFGAGNPPLTLATRNVTLQRHSTIGRTAEHRQLLIEDSAGKIQRVIWWQGADQPLPEGKFEIAYTVRASDYKGQREVMLEFIDWRAAEDVIDLIAEPQYVEVIDYRQHNDPLAMCQQIAVQHPELVIWSEADTRLKGVTRRLLSPSQYLAVWTIPPSPVEWQDILKMTAPHTIYLFGVDPELDGFDPFTRRLAGMVKYVLNHKDGEILTADLAAACAHRNDTMEMGLLWLAAQGQIKILNQTIESFKIAAGTRARSQDVEIITGRLNILLRETAAYRDYWRQQDFTSRIKRA